MSIGQVSFTAINTGVHWVWSISDGRQTINGGKTYESRNAAIVGLYHEFKVAEGDVGTLMRKLQAFFSV